LALPPLPAIPLKWRRAAWIAVPVVLLAMFAGNALWPRGAREATPPRANVPTVTPPVTAAAPVPAPSPSVTAPPRTALPAVAPVLPKSEAPKAEAPKVEAAKVETPKTVAPKVEAVAAPAARASATVGIAVAPWGEVYVNGKKVGVSPPLTELKLAPGSYVIEIRNTTFPPYRTTVDLQTQAAARIRHKFQ